jgi:hypothetical protein
VAAGYAVLGVNPRDGRGRLETGDEATADFAAAVRSAAITDGPDARAPSLAVGKGGAQAAALAAQPDSFSGAVAMGSSEHVEGAATASTLQDLVKAAREKTQ